MNVLSVDLAASGLSQLTLLDPTAQDMSADLWERSRTMYFHGSVTVRVDGHEVRIPEGRAVIVTGSDYQLVLA